MKKIIITMFAFVLMSTAMLTVAHASGGTVSFNNDPKDLQTVTVSDDTTGKCSAGPADGCWKSSITANPGDLVSVQVYFHNTGTATSTDTAVGMSPESSASGTTHTFSGVVAGGTDTSGNVIVRGSATIYTTDDESLTFVPGSVRYFPNQSTSGDQLPGADQYLFSSTGSNIGDVAPGWAGQGVVTADFQVSGSTNTGGNDCYINGFSPSPSSVTAGQSSTLTWSTTGCTSVDVSSVGTGLSANGSETVNPYQTTTYTLTAYPGGETQQTTVDVNNQVTNTCYVITPLYVDSNSIIQGQTTVLHWNTTGGSVYISGFGNEPASGSVSISPYATTTYSLSLEGDNCSGSSQSVTVTVSQSQQQQTGAQPQAITTVASVLSSYSAQLNGIAVPNISYGTTNAWFQYGSTTAVGSSTSPQAINSGLGTNPYSGNISGLAPGGTYYYRAVVQNQYGTAYGSIVPFTIPAATSYTYTPPTHVIVQSSTVTTHSGIVANSQASLFKLEVDSSFDHMCIGGNISYTVNYQNISTETLQNSVLRITFPGELTYASSSQGDYDVTDRTLTIAFGDVAPGQTGSVTVNAQVNSEASVGKLSVITATMVYTNPSTHAQEQAIAYSLITVSNDCPSVLGASVFGFGSFLPSTLLEWLLLILIILALIVLARTLTKKKEEPNKTA
jgi:hypothetical protein